MIEAAEIKKIYDRLSSKLNTQRRQCDSVDSWLRPELEPGFEVPRKATAEHRALRDLSRTPWLRLVVDNVVQAMYVDNVVGENGRIDELWELWNANRMRSQQLATHRAMIAYGHAYGVVSPAQDGSARIRMLSPRRVSVEYSDLGAEPYPSAALELLHREGSHSDYRLRLPGYEVSLAMDTTQPSDAELGGLVIRGITETSLAFVPVVRFCNQIDLDGRVLGEVEPFIPAAQRINKTAYDRLLAQHYNSWRVKTVTGLDMPELTDADGEPIPDTLDEEAAERIKVKLAQDDILTGAEGVTFGTLDATALDPFVNSWRSDIEALAAVSQTPAHALTGQLVNLSAEALAAARAPLTQKVYERQMSAGDSYSSLLRAAAHIAGMSDIARDPLIRVSWQDMEIRSLAQAVDALGKAAKMLHVPERSLWGMIPGVEAADVSEWERAADLEMERDPLRANFARHAESTIGDVTSGSD